MSPLRRKACAVLVSLLAVSGICFGNSSLIGPWFRYDCKELGFQIPVATGWRVTQLPDAVVFAMQYSPHPYVRVAIGRLPREGETAEQMIHQGRPKAQELRRVDCRVDGQEGVKVQGVAPEGPFMDLFVKKDAYWYWIGFSADNKDEWPQYVKTFDIIVDGFKFL